MPAISILHTGRRRGVLAVACATVLLLAVPGLAKASSVVSTESGTLVVVGYGGVNTITVALVFTRPAPGQNYRVTDTSGAITGDPDCTDTGDTVHCSASGITSISVAAQDGNDSVSLASSVPPIASTLRGDAGNDTLTGDDGPDTFFGGVGADDMTGEGGTDTASYADDSAGVVADPGGGANDGNLNDGVAANARDNVRSDIENLTGGEGADTLTGNAAANVLNGGDGADELVGLEGADTLNGEDGGDTLNGGIEVDGFTGGAGADELQALDGNAESVDCGTETDSYTADGTDTLTGCETDLVDTDMDGVPDASDNCNLLAAPTASGCPAAAGALTLKYSAKRKRFKGRLTSPQSACEPGREVTVFKRVPGPDREMGDASTGATGGYKLKKRAGPGKYYSTAPVAVVADVAECAAARSPIRKLG